MKRVISAVEHIQLIPKSKVDVGVDQGREAFLKQIYRRRYHPVFCSSPVVGDEDIASFREYLSEVEAWVMPEQLPSDYLFFLKYYGGFEIGGFDTAGGDYRLATLGVGPMVEEWYGYIAGDDGICEGGLLKMAVLLFDWESGEVGQVHFFLDLVGTIHQYSVIAVPWWKLKGIGLQPVLQDPHSHPTCWTKVADSFTEWLEKAADTAGAFGYVQRREEE